MIGLLFGYVTGLCVWLPASLILYQDASFGMTDRGRKMLLNTLWWPLAALMMLGRLVKTAIIEEREAQDG